MPYFICNGLGDSLDASSPEQMVAFLDALDPIDEEHGAAWVAEDADNALEYNVDGRMVFDCPDGPKYLLEVSKARALELWLWLVSGKLDRLHGLPWRPGAAPPRSAEQMKQLDRARLQMDRSFYDTLGPEHPSEPCRRPDCGRGRVSLSTFCRPHHFENVCRRPCPFSD